MADIEKRQELERAKVDLQREEEKQLKAIAKEKATLQRAAAEAKMAQVAVGSMPEVSPRFVAGPYAAGHWCVVQQPSHRLTGGPCMSISMPANRIDASILSGFCMPAMCMRVDVQVTALQPKLHALEAQWALLQDASNADTAEEFIAVWQGAVAFHS